MPIDTRQKRASAVNVTLPWRTTLPVPDGTIDQADRMQTALMYAGIFVVGPAIPDCVVEMYYLNPIHDFVYPPAYALLIPDALDMDAANPEHDLDIPDRIIFVRCP